MSTHNNQFHDEIIKKKNLLFYFVAIGRTSQGLKNEFELATVNKPSVFELLRFDCI